MKMSIKKSAIALLATASIATSMMANDQIRIVGSSTVYPFTSYVAEEFGATTGFKTPVVESTGSGGGMKIFCAGAGLDTPSFTNASRAMKTKEFETCKANGVTEITGLMVGYDGIAIAQSKENPSFNLTKEQIFLAIAQEVPSKDGKTLIANPYKKWSDIDPTLPNREIRMLGAPTTSGTRDSFDEMVMEKASKSFPAYGEAQGKYKKVRTDGAYIPSGENDNLIVQQLTQDKAALGYFGYSFLEENHDKISGVTLNGIAPTAQNIADGKYPVSRSMFMYMKNAHIGKIKGVAEFMDLYVQDAMIGQKGVLKNIGLIPMPTETLRDVQKSVKARTLLTKEMVEKHTILPIK
jgi:phosphate transport system substrate-binding protein